MMSCAQCGGTHALGSPCVMSMNESALEDHLPPPPSLEVDPLIGSSVGRFKLVRQIGRGGMGSVYLGEQPVIGSRVAVKILHEYLACSPELVNRFYAEARAVNLIGHENIVNIFDMSVAPPNRYYLIMEYLEGDPLSSHLQGPMDCQTAIPILVQVCDALQAAHDHGVIHRDLKPENIFLVRRGRQTPFVKVLDFGIAKLFGSEAGVELTTAGTVVGTPEYMAPEQATGEKVDGRVDLYALGVIAYVMATGRLPFRSTTGFTGMLLAHRDRIPTAPHVLSPQVPLAWSQAIMRALEKAPGDRFQSANQMREALEAILFEPSTPAPAPARAAAPPGPRPSTVQVQLFRQEGKPALRLRALELSRGGLFVCSEADFPPLQSRFKVTVETPAGDISSWVEVVRHVDEAQARAWQMPTGFGVQFVDLSAEARSVLSQFLSGHVRAKQAATQQAAVDPEVQGVLAELHRRGQEAYALLALATDADFSVVRQQARPLIRQLEEFKSRPLPPEQATELQLQLERVSEALRTLGHTRSRLEYDAARGNFPGVARCIAAGITVSELEEERQRFLSQHPKAEAYGQIQFATGNAYESAGTLPLALQAYADALGKDPLNLRIQQRYWGLKRKLQGGTKTA